MKSKRLQFDEQTQGHSAGVFFRSGVGPSGSLLRLLFADVAQAKERNKVLPNVLAQEGERIERFNFCICIFVVCSKV
jgi:hypothetical protein